MRFDIDSYKEVLDTLTRNRSRTLLTGFGVFWGLFMLLFMLGGGDGVKEMLSKNFEGFASNTAILVAERTTKPYKGMQEGRWWSLNTRDIARLKMMVPELDIVTPVVSVWNMPAYNGELSYKNSIVTGVSSENDKVEIPKLKYGRYINSVDEANLRKVCVIGKWVYNDLFPEGGDPCGTFIQVGGICFQIVGVDVSTGGISVNGPPNQKIRIPLPLAQQLFQRGENVDLVCMTAKRGVKVSDIEDRIRQVVAREHLLDPTDKRGLYVLDTQELFSLVDNIFFGVDILLLLIGLGTLTAGAVGVSNIMMVTVKERTIEIGIRRAIGATPRDILTQIMAESVVLTLVSGFLSIVFSVGALSLVEQIASGDTSFQIGFGLAMGAVLLLTVLGLAAGLAPALRAMNIKPVEAMRDE